MNLVHTRDDLAKARMDATGRVAVVMTMGALHEGHATLIRTARAAADHVLATIFVNPLQFGPSEDLSRYPRTLDADLAVCRAEGVDTVFVPAVEEIYPPGGAGTTVHGGPLASILEGASRPGHFDGVLTVVLKLLNLTRPDEAYFGEKDYQQLTLVRGMVADLDLPVRIVGVPTVREADGLALSSRNRFLDPDQRNAALALSRALRAGVGAARPGPDAGPTTDAAPDAVAAVAPGSVMEAGLATRAAEALAAARAVIDAEPGVAVDYLVLTDPMLGPAPDHGPARLLVAARVGTTRLIDNLPVELA